MAQDLGIEVLHFDPDEDMDQSPTDLMSQAHFCVFCFDYLLPKGQFTYTLDNVMRDKVQLPIPLNLLEIIGAGMMAKGIAKLKKKEGLVLPGQEDQGVEIENLPTHMSFGGEGGVFGTLAEVGSANRPDPTVQCEFGYAIALDKVMVGIGIAKPEIGIHQKAIDLLVPEFDLTQSALNAIKKAWNEDEERWDFNAIYKHQKNLDEESAKRESLETE